MRIGLRLRQRAVQARAVHFALQIAEVTRDVLSHGCNASRSVANRTLAAPNMPCRVPRRCLHRESQTYNRLAFGAFRFVQSGERVKLELIGNEEVHPDEAMRSPAAAAKLLAEMRGADPAAALDELSGWLETIKAAPSEDEKIRSEVLSLIQEAGAAHLSALLAQFIARPAGKPAVRESSWKTLSGYLKALSAALYA